MRDCIVWVAVRMRIHRDLPKCALQVLGRRLPSDSEHLVVVALDRHSLIIGFRCRLYRPAAVQP